MTKKKYLLVGKTNTIVSLDSLFNKTKDIESRLITNYPDSTFNYDDIWWFLNCDAVFVDGTWGSQNPMRQYSPFKSPKNSKWQAAGDPSAKPEEHGDFNKDNFSEDGLFNPNTAYANLSNFFFVELAKHFNKPLIVTESATLSRIKLNHLDGWYKRTGPRYYRMGLGHWVYSRAKWCKPKSDERLHKLVHLTKQHVDVDLNNIFDFKWKNNKDGDILLISGMEHDPTSSIPVDEFIKKTYFELRKYTNRKILIKPHPLSKINIRTLVDEKAVIIDNQIQIKDLASTLYCAILDSSTSIFQLINLGIPTFTSEFSFGHLLGNIDVSQIENLNYASPQEVYNWYKKMSYTEFTIEEFSDPEILFFIEELLGE